jgi:hypothetical protein
MVFWGGYGERKIKKEEKTFNRKGKSQQLSLEKKN